MAELDPAFQEYRSRWGTLLKLNERDAAQAYMRGEALNLAGDGHLDRRPGQVALFLRVNGRGLDGAADPGALDDMVAEWQAFLGVAPPSDPRAYAKQYIVRVVGANRHLDAELGPMAMCAALWLMDSEESMAELRAGEAGFLCDITVDHNTRDMRVQISLLGDE